MITRIRNLFKALFIALTCTHERNKVIRHGYKFTIVCRRCGKEKRVRVMTNTLQEKRKAV